MCRDLGRTEAQLHRQSPRIRSVLSRLSLQARASSKTGDRFELQPIPRQLPVGSPFWGIACLCDAYTSKVGTFEATCALDYEEQETEAGLSMARSLLELSNGRRSALVPCLRQMKSSGGSIQQAHTTSTTSIKARPPGWFNAADCTVSDNG